MTEESGGLGQTTARAGAWYFASTMTSRAIAFLSLAILARMLAPEQFGLLALVLTYMVYADTIGDFGTTEALMYWPDRREDAAQVTFVVNIVAGLFWFVLTLLLAPYIAEFFKAPEGTPLVRVLAWTFLIKYLGNTHDALAQKDLRFSVRGIPEVGLSLVKATVSILLAYRGYGAWSLVWGHLAGSLAWTIGVWIIEPWRPTWSFPSDLVRPMLKYGRGLTFVDILGTILAHSDFAAVGRFLGPAALGIYQMASRIPDPMTVFAGVVSRVLFPAFSKLYAAGKSVQAAYLVAARYVAAITIPTVTGLCLLARPIVLICFGPKWIAAAPIVSVLSILAGIQALSNHAGDVLKGTGRAGLLARIESIRAVVVIPAVVIGAMKSALAVAIALTIADGAMTIVAFILSARATDISLRSVARAFAPSALSAAVMGLAVEAWLRFGPDNLADLLTVIVAVAIGIVVYVAMLALTDRDIFRRAYQHFMGRRGAAVPAEGVAEEAR